MKQISLFLTALLLLLSLGSCNEYARIQKSTDYEYKYEVAKQYYAQGYYNRAALFISEVLSMLKGTDKGEESLYLLAMCSYRADNYDAAVTYFRKYYQSYPKGHYVEEARYYTGLSLYKNTPEPKLDQTATFEAITEFQNFIEVYPQSPLRAEAQDMIFKLQDKLVEKEYLSAKQYYDLGDYIGNGVNGNYQACITTAENAIRDYPFTTRREDFAILILRSKFELAKQSIESRKVERYHNAIDEYYGFVTEYPESKYMKEAQALFEKAGVYVETEESDAPAQPESTQPESGEK